MRQIRNDKELQEAILELKHQRRSEGLALQTQWDHTRKNLNPIAWAKEGVMDLFRSPDVKSGALKGLLSLATGFVTRKLVVGNSGGIVRKVVGTLAQTGATSLAYKGTGAIQEKGASWLSKTLKKMKIGK
ncbi:hypothetical protein [Flavobacterium sp.]|uniref:hypothetical protein n=1 Tax=Flavobacterium sp. TaxID=239 RepID=UPI0012010BE2|nr:hypothetical protein [Flavobacterium sp.]RZJ71042.1 MAG: hypothetical protein EOO49_11340 [Flavobacterium sp.]